VYYYKYHLFERKKMANYLTAIKHFTRRSRLVLLTAIFGLTFAVTGTVSVLPLTGHSTVDAQSCTPQYPYPKTDIIYCGLSGPSDSDYINSISNYYDSNNDGYSHTDIQTVLNWAGASPAMIAGMNTSNTVIGTAYSDGTVTVNGQLVGTGVLESGRWNPGTGGFTNLEGDVWYRAATTYFAPTSQAQVIVHFNSYGQADFAIMIECGNVLKFQPMPPKVLTCDGLTPSEVDTSLTYNFTAKATAENETISSYTFNFGDGTSQTVDTSNTTATTSHTYSATDTAFTANVLVNNSVTSDSCRAQLTTPSPNLVCVQLTASQPADNSQTQYTFTAQGSAQNTAITSYTFNFGDNTSATVPTSGLTASTTHTYAPGTYSATVTVNGENNQTATSPNCVAQITVQSPPAQPTTPAQPTQLVNTGPGDVIALVGLATVLGAVGHNLLMRRLARR